jgi:hypothetical protein
MRNILFLILSLLVVLAMAGCNPGEQQAAASAENAAEGKGGEETSDNGKSAPSELAAEIKVEVANIQEGIAMFRSLVKDFKRQIESNEEAPALQTSLKITAVWNAIKEEVKGTHPEVHVTIDEHVGLLAAKVQEKPLDTSALVDLDYQLYQELRKLSAEN